MKNYRTLIAFGLVMSLLLLAVPFGARAQTQTPPSQYFAQTNHSVQGEFLRFFQTRGGLEILGYPLTETFVENGRNVQYFQRARLELHPEASEPDRVQLGLIGVELDRSEPAIPAAGQPAPNDPNRRYYPETGHTVCCDFVQYLDAHGGPRLLGYPIAEEKKENGRWVQYFQRVKMEWWPEMPKGQRVRLGNLGEIYVLSRLDKSYTDEPPATFLPGQPRITSLRVEASMQSAVVRPSGKQTLHVYVTDQRGEPVALAATAVTLRSPVGDQSLTLPPTDGNGHTQYSFDLARLQPGHLVVIEIHSSWSDLAAGTQTSFFVWW